MSFKKKSTEMEDQGSLNFRGRQIELDDSVTALGVLIDGKLTFSQQFSSATNRVLQRFLSIERNVLSNQSLSPNTLKIICKTIVFP